MESTCLCGAVRWWVDAPLTAMWHCHCGRCRKAHGAPFATYALAPAASHRLEGAESILRFALPGGGPRCFCRHCGSVVPGEPFEGLCFLPAGNLTSDPGIRPQGHMFVRSKAPWYEVPDDGLPQFEAFPPGIDAPGLPDLAPVEPRVGALVRGSCLCRSLAFVLEGPPKACRNCHCTRCRKARSAAHASNLVTTPGALRFTRGAELLSEYKLPDARYFTQTFCRLCGSLMPRVDSGRAIAIVPMGSLDDDPGIRPSEHIFVASKAPWFAIADKLPQYSEQRPT